MKAAYVDASWVIAIAFAERGAAAFKRRLDGFDEIFSANLLEAEVRAAFKRERIEVNADFFERISWIVPDRPMHDEIEKVLSVCYVHGADCWHLASALYLTDAPDELVFLTLDERQREVAIALGFQA